MIFSDLACKNTAFFVLFLLKLPKNITFAPQNRLSHGGFAQSFII